MSRIKWETGELNPLDGVGLLIPGVVLELLFEILTEWFCDGHFSFFLFSEVCYDWRGGRLNYCFMSF